MVTEKKHKNMKHKNLIRTKEQQYQKKNMVKKT